MNWKPPEVKNIVEQKLWPKLGEHSINSWRIVPTINYADRVSQGKLLTSCLVQIGPFLVVWKLSKIGGICDQRWRPKWGEYSVNIDRVLIEP